MRYIRWDMFTNRYFGAFTSRYVTLLLCISSPDYCGGKQRRIHRYDDDRGRGTQRAKSSDHGNAHCVYQYLLRLYVGNASGMEDCSRTPGWWWPTVRGEPCSCRTPIRGLLRPHTTRTSVTKGVSLVSTVHQVISETTTTTVSLVDCVSGSVW
jgi:hypothetical protein